MNRTGIESKVAQLSRHPLTRRVSANVVARVLAVLAVALATVMVARVSGKAGVGEYALLRIMPGLLGVLSICGLQGTFGWFLAEQRRLRTGLWPAIVAIAVGGALLGTVIWVAASPVLARVWFTHTTVAVVAFAGLTIGTQLLLTLGKTALQGLDDARGGDRVIAAEELAFLPAYGLALVAGLESMVAIVVGLAVADLVVGWYAWRRVARTWAGLTGRRLGRMIRGRIDPALVREVLGYGLRAQVGGVVTLLNLRLDMLILGAFAGPAVVGVYAVASKFAEVLRLPGTALTWVAYPRLAGLTKSEADHTLRRMLLPAALAVALAAVPVALLVGPLIDWLYGADFAEAAPLARLLLVGLLLAGAAGVASGYLFGRGFPGRNSAAVTAGLVVTVVLDLLLIPSYGVWGAAVASVAAYLVADAMAVLLAWRESRTDPRP